MSRSNYHIRTLEVHGYNDRFVQNKFFDQSSSANTLAMILPGMRYTCDMPLLYYTTETLLIKGYDVLQLWADYDQPEFQKSTQAEQAQCLMGDSLALLETVEGNNRYQRLILVGKSLGTLSMTFLLNMNENLTKETTIWLTPLLNLAPVAQAVQNLKAQAFLAGSSSDSTFDAEAVNQIQSMSNVTVEVVADADHSLEIPDNMEKSVLVLSQVMNSLNSFLS